MVLHLEEGQVLEGDVCAAQHEHSFFIDGKLRPEEDIPMNVVKVGRR